MFLSTIGPKDFPMRKFKKLDTSRDWSINLYNLDIEGSSPRRFGALNQKIDFTNKNDDIERSWPKQLHVGLNKPEYNLRNDDIEKSSPQCVEIKTTRHTNPLEPKYKLASTEDYPPEIPKFIRDQIDVKDIEGAQPTKKISLNILSDPLKKDDIKDSWPKKPYVRKKVIINILIIVMFIKMIIYRKLWNQVIKVKLEIHWILFIIWDLLMGIRKLMVL
jgi:hypothetical protein